MTNVLHQYLFLLYWLPVSPKCCILATICAFMLSFVLMCVSTILYVDPFRLQCDLYLILKYGSQGHQQLLLLSYPCSLSANEDHYTKSFQCHISPRCLQCILYALLLHSLLCQTVFWSFGLESE